MREGKKIKNAWTSTQNTVIKIMIIVVKPFLLTKAISGQSGLVYPDLDEIDIR